MKASLKSLVQGTPGTEATKPSPSAPPPEQADQPKRYRTAQTRTDTRQVSGHFKPEVARTLRLIAVEQDRDVQEILAEALNMLFTRYGKATQIEITSGRRRKVTT
jgi:hypothetical protein